MTKEQRHRCMSHIRSKDTKPEIRVRQELYRRGFRYRLNVRKLPGTPDIVISRYRTAIFINGCFWHGHKGCRLFVMPKSNTEFWESKITRNRRRDFIATSMLEALSWNVITIWECELSPRKFKETMDKVESLLATNRKAWEEYRKRRRSDREFAMAERKRQKEVEKIKEDELQGMYHIPQSIIRLSRSEPK
ncbi:MAG: very short patch repair endonuclease [Paraprevotella sp.]|nr:very short patch repair endonuclease [Paraprevotella sp.]